MAALEASLAAVKGDKPKSNGKAKDKPAARKPVPADEGGSVKAAAKS
jgi:hypothetical protein